MTLKTLEWRQDHLRLIDQTLLPEEQIFLDCFSGEEVWKAIKCLAVRGAPAIGVAAAYGLYLALKDKGSCSRKDFDQEMTAQLSYFQSCRPTAVNLMWALERLRAKASEFEGSCQDLLALLLEEAQAIDAEDKQLCQNIGLNGAALISDGAIILTHCNAGALATAGSGTALAVMYEAQAQGKVFKVFADETRPLLQGARLTAWELSQSHIDVTVITDGMAAHVMRDCGVSCVIVGADRIAANGDTANKIGTYGLAVLAQKHQIPFYVAAPFSTFDFSLENGDQIPIEERDEGEMRVSGRLITPPEAKVYNPAFDVTPRELISALITDQGVISHPDRESIEALLGQDKVSGGQPKALSETSG